LTLVGGFTSKTFDYKHGSHCTFSMVWFISLPKPWLLDVALHQADASCVMKSGGHWQNVAIYSNGPSLWRHLEDVSWLNFSQEDAAMHIDSYRNYYRKKSSLTVILKLLGCWLMNGGVIFFLARMPILNIIFVSWMSQSTRTGCIVIVYCITYLEHIHVTAAYGVCPRHFKTLQSCGFTAPCCVKCFFRGKYLPTASYSSILSQTRYEGERFEARNEPVDRFLGSNWTPWIDDPQL